VFNNTGDRLKLLTVSNWGPLALGNTGSHFYGCSNFNSTATDAPTIGTSLYQSFRGCSTFNGSVANFDTSSVTNMGSLFYDCSVFNQSVANFDTSSVTNMGSLFRGCSFFNQSLANFDTSSVTNMGSLFYDCSVFNQSVANFDTSSVTTMSYMFRYCSAFNQDISGFDITALVAPGAISMLQYSGFTQTNYDLLLVAWEGQAEPANIQFHAGAAKFGAGAPATARAALVANGWTITDGGPA